MENLTVDLVKQAENREYTRFEETAKELLKMKLEQSDKFKEIKSKLSEACCEKGDDKDDKDDDNDPDSKDAKQNSDDEDGDGKKDKDEEHGDLKKDFTGKHKDADKED